MRNPNRNVFVSEFEFNKPLPKSRMWPQFVAVDELENGHLVRKMKYEMQDRCEPVTPQSGIDVHIGELAFSIKNNLNIEHTPAYLSRLGRNPFEQAVFVDKLTNDYESLINKSKQKESNEV